MAAKKVVKKAKKKAAKAKKPIAKAASKKKTVKPQKAGKDGLLGTLALAYIPLADKLNYVFNNNRDEYFAKFKAAVGNNPANYKFGEVVRRLPATPGSAIGMEPDPNNAHNPGKWLTDVGGIREWDRKLLQMVIAGNIFAKEPMDFEFVIDDGKGDPRVDVSTYQRRNGAHVLKIAIFCA